ncbi:MAG: MYG1 family protein [Clostridia bacterium]|jgi:uncharacterized UPF0160 family protein|nr:MYG1 family protein [Clostridia bacterium]
MDLKILSSLDDVTINRKYALIIGTHNGIFHSDDVFACALLYLAHHKQIYILRTRDEKMLKECDICVDIGGGEFDHHQIGFNKTRSNGIKYASAGLVWKSYGEELVKSILEQYFPGTTLDTDYIFNLFDESYVSLVDCEDNGVKVEPHRFSYISSFLPPWTSNAPDDFNRHFYQVLVTTIYMVEQTIQTILGKEIAYNIITDNYRDQFFNGILEIPSQTINWLETVISINDSVKGYPYVINFVIFPYPNGGWAAQCVPPSIKEVTNQRIPFPKEWAGQTDQLSEISKVEGAEFCHNNLFFVRATTQDAVIRMCNIATQRFDSKNSNSKS